MNIEFHQDSCCFSPGMELIFILISSILEVAVQDDNRDNLITWHCDLISSVNSHLSHDSGHSAPLPPQTPSCLFHPLHSTYWPPQAHTQGYFIAFSPYGGKGKRKSWLVCDFDGYFKWMIPFLAKFEIPSKLLTILEIANVELDLKLISKWWRKSHFSFPDATVLRWLGDFHVIIQWKNFHLVRSYNQVV